MTLIAALMPCEMHVKEDKKFPTLHFDCLQIAITNTSDAHQVEGTKKNLAFENILAQSINSNMIRSIIQKPLKRGRLMIYKFFQLIG